MCVWRGHLNHPLCRHVTKRSLTVGFAAKVERQFKRAFGPRQLEKPDTAQGEGIELAHNMSTHVTNHTVWVFSSAP